MPNFYEFFAGGGMARAGLGSQWACRFANDFDVKKGEVYKLNWGSEDLKVCDIRQIYGRDLPGVADLAWASFPCQDLSLAGFGAGLSGDRSGTFWTFWNLIKTLRSEGRAPSMIVLENVLGTLTSRAGEDFAAIATALSGAQYNFGAVVIDAELFVPHSRPRLFIIAVRDDVPVQSDMILDHPSISWHTNSLQNAYKRLNEAIRDRWIWWKLPLPAIRTTRFSDLIEENETGLLWNTENETKRLLEMMSPLNLQKLETVKRTNEFTVGTIYKRTRINELGARVQRAEVRFDNIAGCLRTPAGGSSRQLILLVKGKDVRSRLITGRETARLMGLPEDYILPKGYNETYHLTGDGVVVPVVRHIAAHLLEPILRISGSTKLKSRVAA